MNRWLLLFTSFLVGLLGFGVAGCVSTLPPTSDSFPTEGTIALGRVKVMLSGPTTRWYQPEIRFIEVHHVDSDQRFRLDIEAEQSLLALALPPGHYRVTRVQIREGGFRGMAHLSASFSLEPNSINYVGTWTFELASPFYNRDLGLIVSSELVETLAEASMTFDDFTPSSITTKLAEPLEFHTRFFEVTPYPRVRWFQRRPTS